MLFPPPPLQHLPLIFLPSQITFLSSPSKPRPYNSMGNCRKILHEISKGTTFFLISLETNLPLKLLCKCIAIHSCLCLHLHAPHLHPFLDPIQFHTPGPVCNASINMCLTPHAILSPLTVFICKCAPAGLLSVIDYV